MGLVAASRRSTLINRYFGVVFDVLLAVTPEIRACACREIDIVAHNTGVSAGQQELRKGALPSLVGSQRSDERISVEFWYIRCAG